MTTQDINIPVRARVCACGGRGGCRARGLTGRRRFLAALRNERVDRPPVWFMRQAGRHLPGYRALRTAYSFLDLCREPEVNRIASAEPVQRYGVDAAIVFNDILIPLMDMGMGLDFAPGPRFERRVTSAAEARALGAPRYDDRTPVCRCLSTLREDLGAETALLGFIGAPFTVAAFAVAGAGPQRTRSLSDSLIAAPETFCAMQEQLVEVLAQYAAAQARAGADAIQVFESLAADLDPAVYQSAALPFLIAVVQRVRELAPQTPLIVFGRGLWDFVPALAEQGATLSLDAERPLAAARRMLDRHGLTTALQGNLPPEALLDNPRSAAGAARALLADWHSIVPLPDLAPELGPTGWIFNLGHGVPEGASPDAVQAVVNAVRDFRVPAAVTAGEGLS